MKTFLKLMHTGKDNISYDPARVWGSVLMINFIILAWVNLFLSPATFSLVIFVTAAGGLMNLICASILMKHSTEPDPKESPNER